MQIIFILIAAVLMFFLIYRLIDHRGTGVINVKNRSDRNLDINIFRAYDTRASHTREDLGNGEDDTMENLLAGSYYSVIAVGHSYYEREKIFLPKNKTINVEFDD